MSIEIFPVDNSSGDDLLNPTLIAQIASRIYNEVPRVSEGPKNEQEAATIASGHANPSAFSQNVLPASYDHPLDLSNIGNLLEHDSGTDSSHLGFGLESTKQLASGYGKLPDTDPGEYYFLKGAESPKEAPLSAHTDNLLSQQNFSRNKNHTPNLQQFVQKVQVASVGFSEQKQTVPFFESFGNGLSSEPIDFSFLFANAQTHVKPEVPSQTVKSPYYFINEPSHPTFPSSDIFDVTKIRRDFPVLHQQVHGKQLVWFDNAATTQKPQSVIDVIFGFYSHDNSNIHRGAHTLAARATDGYEGAREKVRRFIGANSTAEIIFVRGTTEGINLVAQTWGRKNIQPGDEILVSVLEHHANIVPWQMLAKENGAILRPIPVNDRGEILLDEYTRLLNSRTKLVSITQASNGLGTILPIKDMIQLAKRFDTKILVDGAQSIAHLAVNVQELDADFFVFSGHKIFGPTGIGVVYGKKEILENMPPWQGGGNMIQDVTFEETKFNTIPNKFEAGTPNVADAIGLGAALDYVNKIGIKNIAEYEHKLTIYGTEQLRQIPGLRLIGTAKEKVGVLSFVLNNIPTEQVGRFLDREGIAVRAGHHCAQPALRRFGVESTVRPSLAFYNTFDEIDRLVIAVKRLQHQ